MSCTCRGVVLMVFWHFRCRHLSRLLARLVTKNCVCIGTRGNLFLRAFSSKRRFFRRNYCILRIFFPRVTLLASSGQPQRQRFKKTSETKTLNVQHTDVVKLDWNGDAIVAIVAEKWQRPFTPKRKFASSLHQWRSSWLRFRRWDITIQRLKS